MEELLQKQREKLDDNIYTIALHDCVQVGMMEIVRVPGGWIYFLRGEGGTFVPFDNEYQTASKQD